MKGFVSVTDARAKASRIAAAALLLAAAPAPRWMAVATRPDGSAVEVNAAAIGTVRGLTRGWWRLRRTRPRADGGAVETRLIVIDCARLRGAVLETIVTRPDGTVLGDARADEATALAHPAAMTDDAAARAICQLRPAARRR